MEIWSSPSKLVQIPWKYEVLHPKCCKYHQGVGDQTIGGIHALHMFIRRNPQEHLLSIQLQRCCRWLQDELPDTQIQIWNEIPNSANPVSSCVIWRRFSAPQLWNISRYSVFIVFVKTWFCCALYFYCAVLLANSHAENTVPRWFKHAYDPGHLSSVLSSASCLISPLTRSCAVQLHDKKVGVTSATSATRAIQRTIRFTLKGIRSENDESNDSMMRSKCKKQATRKMCFARTWLGKGPNILRSCILLSSWTATPHHSHTSPVRKMLPEESIWRELTPSAPLVPVWKVQLSCWTWSKVDRTTCGLWICRSWCELDTCAIEIQGF
jgi:hypothetical protein